MNGINQTRIKFSQLRALVAVADCGNFSEAALQLEISQPAISHAIATLENELGVPLLARGRQGAHLTPVGEELIADARQVLQLLDRMATKANLHKGLHGGQVRVAAFRTAAAHVLPEIVARFRDRYPKITVTITEYYDSWEVARALRQGKSDVGLMDLPTSDDFETWEILRDEYIVLLPPTAPLSSSQLSWEQLATYPLISVAPGNSCYAALQHYLKACGVSLNVAYEVSENPTMVSMVAQGLGAAILPRLSAQPIPPQVQVCRLPTPLERVIGAGILANALQRPAVFAFMDTLKETPLVMTGH